MREFDLYCKWDDEGVNIYVNDEKVGKIPKGVKQAVLNATAPRLSDGKEVRLFRYVLTPNYDEQSINVQLFEDAAKLIEYQITADAKNVEIVKEK